MSEHPGPTLLQVVGEGFSAPLVGLCVVAGVVVTLATRERGPAPLDGAGGPGGVVVVTTTSTPGGDRPPSSPDGQPAPAEGTPTRPATAAEIEALIARGDFAGAEAWARASRGLDGLADRALLLEALSRTITPGPLAGATHPVRVTTLEGEVLLGVVKAETSDDLTLVLRDGRERALARAGLRQREALTPEAARLALDEALRRERAALGARAPGLALHRLAHHAFASGLRGLGAALLVEALRTPEGQVLVDMFGTGDIERLHAARRGLEAAPASGASGAEGPLAALPRPTEPPRTPSIEPAPPTEPEPDEPEPQPQPLSPVAPEPEPEPAPVVFDDEAIFTHAAWRGAETAYRTGLQLYRSAFDGPQHQNGPTIRAALAQFRQGQDLLDRLLRELPDAASNHEVERRIVELNALVLDCTKRLGTD